MDKTILFIDGENFLHKIKEVVTVESGKKQNLDLSRININNLLSKVLNNIFLAKKYFYAAKLQLNKDTLQKSQLLISRQRSLKTNLEKQGFEFISAGNVRPQKVGKETIFKEKGVDVRIAVDLVAMACDKLLKTAILCSSDSDLQPAVKEVRKRGIEIIYLGFELVPNKGLSYTTNRAILFRNSEIIEMVKK